MTRKLKRIKLKKIPESERMTLEQWYEEFEASYREAALFNKQKADPPTPKEDENE